VIEHKGHIGAKVISLFVITIFLFTIIMPTPQVNSANTPISPTSYRDMLGVGINVNWVLFKKIIGAYTPTVPLAFKQIGFSHVRIRADEDTDISLLKKVVDDSLKAGLVPIIAFAGSNIKEKPTQENEEKSARWWKKVGEAFQGYPYTLSYDLMIEPGKNINDHIDILNKFYTDSLHYIRAVDPYRIVFVSPPFTSSIYHVDDLKVPWDSYTMLQWHFFAGGPSLKNPAKKWTVGTKEEKGNIWHYIDTARQWTRKTGIPSWVGAWMPGNYNKGNTFSIPQQIAFAHFMSCSLLYARIPFAINAGQHFYDYKTYTWRNDRYTVLMTILYPCIGRGKMLFR